MVHGRICAGGGRVFTGGGARRLLLLPLPAFSHSSAAELLAAAPTFKSGLRMRRLRHRPAWPGKQVRTQELLSSFPPLVTPVSHLSPSLKLGLV